MPAHPAFLQRVLRLQICHRHFGGDRARRNEFLRGERRAASRLISHFLKSGGSKFPLETLKAAGVDMTTSAPVESTLRVFERRLDELEALLLG